MTSNYCPLEKLIPALCSFYPRLPLRPEIYVEVVVGFLENLWRWRMLPTQPRLIIEADTVWKKGNLQEKGVRSGGHLNHSSSEILWVSCNHFKAGFDLTFREWFMSFPSKITAKLILIVGHHGWAIKKIFHSRLTKKNHKPHFFIIFILLNNTRFASYFRRLL